MKVESRGRRVGRAVLEGMRGVKGKAEIRINEEGLPGIDKRSAESRRIGDLLYLRVNRTSNCVLRVYSILVPSTRPGASDTPRVAFSEGRLTAPRPLTLRAPSFLRLGELVVTSRTVRSSVQCESCVSFVQQCCPDCYAY
jgi:hypothetical protein